MSTTATEIFKITYRSGMYVAFICASAVWLVVSWPWGLPLVIAFSGFLAITALIPAVAVGDQGLVLYSVNHLAWHQVAAVRGSKVLGFPYAVVTRHRGFRWWIPLYVVGERSLLAALASRAPAGNPLQVFAEAASNNSFKPNPLRGSA